MRRARIKYKICAVLMSAAMTLSFCACNVSSGKVTDRNSDASTAPREVTVYMPQITEKDTLGNDRVTIDVSNVSQGYIAVKYIGDNQKPKMQIVYGENTYTYSLSRDGQYSVYPLTCGDGKYAVNIYENIDIEQNKYLQAFGTKLNVELENEFLPFLYPNVYVNYTADGEVVKLSNKLTQDITDELEVVAAVYEYVTSKIYYDEDKAENIGTVYAYAPDLEDILRKKKGICFDYASLMTAMLRAQDIPSKLIFGYAGSAYHAWISVYISEIGWIDGIIQFDGTDWTRMDPTFAANGATQNSSIREFIGDGTNYNEMYFY